MKRELLPTVRSTTVVGVRRDGKTVVAHADIIAAQPGSTAAGQSGLNEAK